MRIKRNRLLEGFCCACRIIGLDQNFSPHFLEIGVLRLFFDKGVEFRQGCARRSVQIGRDGTAVARGQSARIVAEHALERAHIAGIGRDLCASHVVAKLEGGGIGLVVIGALLRKFFQIGDTFARKRVADPVLIDLRPRK